MRVFVTGATGFIGSAIVQELIHAGPQVLGCSEGQSDRPPMKSVGYSHSFVSA